MHGLCICGLFPPCCFAVSRMSVSATNFCNGRTEFRMLYAQVPTFTAKPTTTDTYLALGTAGSSTPSTCHALHKPASSASPVKPAADRGALSSWTLSCGTVVRCPNAPSMSVCWWGRPGVCQMGLCMGPGAGSLVRPTWRPAPPKTVSVDTTTTLERH